MKKWPIVILVLITLLSLFIVIKIGWFDAKVAWAVFIVVFGGLGCIGLLRILINTEMNRPKEIRDFNYVMNRMNEALRRRDNPDTFGWAGGEDVKYQEKYYPFPGTNKQSRFAAVVADLQKRRTPVHLIYSFDTDTVISFIDNPSPALITNPFKDFKPFESSFNPMALGRYDRRRKTRRPIHIDIGDNYDDMQGGGSPFGPDEDVSRAAYDTRGQGEYDE